MKLINRFAEWLEKHFLPVASAIGRQKHLAAMRDGFIAIMPISLMGAIVVLFNNVFLGSDTLIGELFNKMPFWANSIQPIIDVTLIPLFGQIWWGTLALGVVFSTFTISYNLAKSYEVDGLSAGVIATVCYLTLTPQAASEVAGWGTLSWTSFNSSAVFTGLIVAILSTEIFRIMTQKGFTIKMPKEVPPAVSKAFSAVIPGGTALLIFGIISIYFLNVVGMPFKDWIEAFLQQPLVSLGQSPFTYILLITFSQLLWFFGLHGLNIVGPILDTMYAPALQQNAEAILITKTLAPNVLTRNFLDVYGMHGGSGATLGLIIAIYVFSKRQEHKELAKLSVGPGVFQINEPVIYGLPIVLNPIMFIPFVITPGILVFLAWLFTGPIPLLGRIYIAPPWVTPPVISAFLSTGGNIPATIFALVTVILSIVIYAPFVIVANKEAENRQREEAR